MKVRGIHRRSIALAAGGRSIEIIDQRALPHRLAFAELGTAEEVARAIREMWLRGAPLIGAAAAYGMWLALREDSSDDRVESAYRLLALARPTAVNLRWALDEVRAAALATGRSDRAEAALAKASAIAEDDVAGNRAIGHCGLELLRAIHACKPPGGALNVLTHCNAGWLATVDWGTALAPVYLAHDEGMSVHVWVDETRPRNQGSLTAWELGEHGVPHTVVVDNAGGHLMQHGSVDLCIVGADRVTAGGDVCNKVGTYLKALAARDNGIPFYVALPHSTIDWTIDDGLRDIPIEERDPAEVHSMSGVVEGTGVVGGARTVAPDGRGEPRDFPPPTATVRLLPQGCRVANYAFDVTPGRLVTALVTERGPCAASREGLLSLYPERAAPARQPLQPLWAGGRAIRDK
jgi:methylthioribose-1-phosphate isomerase